LSIAPEVARKLQRASTTLSIIAMYTKIHFKTAKLKENAALKAWLKEL